jgi:assimilatory nitrate reductase catalytic subunit
MGSNVAVASPHAGNIIERLRSLDFLAVCDPFVNETTDSADVVLPVTQWAEEDGTMTNLEGRVIRRRRVTQPPEGVRSDVDIIHGLADRLGFGEKFAFESSEDVFNEFRRATAGGIADYAGITYDRIDRQNGVFWPCPSEAAPDTPRLFTERFHHPDGKARFHAVEHRDAGEEPDADYPLYFTTGRYQEHYNSGVQTRRVDRLNKAKPMPRLQMHPELAERYGLDQGGVVTVESRRASVEFEVELSTAIRPDTVFAPFHWGGRHAANLLTNAALDPTSRMPEFKLAAVRIIVARPAETTVG